MADFAWAGVWTFCDIESSRALICTKRFKELKIVHDRRMDDAAKGITRFLRKSFRENPWRISPDPFDELLGDTYNMRLMLRINAMRIGKKYNKNRLIRFLMHGRDLPLGYDTYIFSRKSSDEAVQKERQQIMDNYGGSRYSLCKFVRTFSAEEVIQNGI